MKSMKERIILYGAGKIGQEAALLLKQEGKEIECFIDKSKEKHGEIIENLKVYYLKEVRLNNECIIYISTIKDTSRIVSELLAKGVKKEKIILYELFRIEYLAAQIRQTKEIIYGNDEKKIVFGCYNGLGLGGIEEWTKQIMAQLRKYNYKTSIIYSGKKLENNEKNIYIDKGLLSSDSIKIINKIIDLILKNNCGVIITSQPDDILRAACSTKLVRPDIKIICVIHGGIEANYERYPLYNKYVDAYVGVSEDICRELRNRGIDKDKIYHMTCPVKIMSKNKKRLYTTDINKSVNIGYAGRIEIEQKRMDLLLKLIFELEKKHINYHMNIAGDGSYKEHMELIIKEKGLLSKVDFLGKIDRSRIPDFWQHNDICVNVADYEGRSISVMEAMVNGAVPIVTQTSGVKEDVHNGLNGYYVDIEDYKKIGEYVSYLDKNRKELSRLGIMARKEMEEKCNIDNHVEFWCNLLEKV